jgi:hypothetical protein
MCPQPLILRHEDVADGVVAGLRQLDVELGAFLDEEVVRYLDQNARSIAGDWVGAHGAAMLEVLEDVERVLDDAMRFAALEVGDEADAAGVIFAARVEQAAGLGKSGASSCATSWSGAPLVGSIAVVMVSSLPG